VSKKDRDTHVLLLPDVEDAYGPVYGLGNGSKRKDAERQASIDACEKLDMLGILRLPGRKGCVNC